MYVQSIGDVLSKMAMYSVVSIFSPVTSGLQACGRWGCRVLWLDALSGGEMYIPF